MTLEEMKKRKKELGYTNEQISELSGVPLGTVQKVFSGATETPRYDTMRALENVLRKRESTYGDAVMVKESTPYYAGKKQGEYTLGDYYALPEEQRVELIDGVFYDMASPLSVHQLIGGKIYQILSTYIEKKDGECLPFIAPMDVQLDCDDRTMVQPDVFVVCDRNKVTRKVIYGAPDFVVEVLSAGTKKKDMYIKLMKYMNAGVKEYWMVDPSKKIVLVYDFQRDNDVKIYGFDAKVPVGIFEEGCQVDFSVIDEYVSFLYEEQ